MAATPGSDSRLSFEPLVQRRRLVLALFALLAAGAAPGLLRLEMDNSPETFFVRDARGLARYRDFEARFGRDRAVRVVVAGEALFSVEGLRWLAEIEERAEEIRGVAGAAGLYRHHRWRLSEWPPEPTSFRSEVVRDPLDAGAGWISRDAGTATVLVGLNAMPPEERRATLAELTLLLEDAPPGLTASLVGLPLLEEGITAEMLRVARRIFPVVALLACALLVFYFGLGLDLLAPLLLVALCLTVVFGAMGWLRASLNLVLFLLAPLMFVISLATAVHVLAHFRRARSTGLEATAAVIETYRWKAWPVTWTGLTTALGFGSLMVSPMPPVRDLGAWACFGLAFFTLAALSFYPALLASLSGSRRSSSPLERRAGRSGRRLARWAAGQRRSLYLAFGLMALIFCLGAARLRSETALLSYFPPQHPVRTDVENLEAAGLGTVAAELVLRAPRSDPTARFDRPQNLDLLRRLGERLRQTAPIRGAVSLADFHDSLTRHLPASESPEEERATVAALVAERAELGRLQGFLVADEGRHVRLALLLPMGSFSELQPTFERAVAEARRLFPESEAWITGRYPLVLAAQRALLRTMLASLGLTVAGIAVALLVALRSRALAARALLPNLWPVAGVLGLMGWADVQVDSTTLMVAAVTLGLAVDDTLHFLGSYRLLARSGSRAAATALTLERGAGAYMLTSAILVVGFAGCALTDLLAIARFGALMAVAVVFALVGDLLLVPALLGSAGAKEPA